MSPCIYFCRMECYGLIVLLWYASCSGVFSASRKALFRSFLLHFGCAAVVCKLLQVEKGGLLLVIDVLWEKLCQFHMLERNHAYKICCSLKIWLLSCYSINVYRNFCIWEIFVFEVLESFILLEKNVVLLFLLPVKSVLIPYLGGRYRLCSFLVFVSTLCNVI